MPFCNLQDQINFIVCLSDCFLLKVSGPFVETSCVFQCIKNIANDEMWA